MNKIIIAPQVLLREAYNLGQCLLKNSPKSLRWTKGLLSEHARHQLDREVANATLWNARSKEDDDFREGIRAFLEKRPPNWPSRQSKLANYPAV